MKVGGALEPVSEERRFWLGLSFMVGVWGQVSPGSGNSSGGLRYSSSEVMGLLKGDVDPPGKERKERQWQRETPGEEGGTERMTQLERSAPDQGPDKVWNVSHSLGRRKTSPALTLLLGAPTCVLCDLAQTSPVPKPLNPALPQTLLTLILLNPLSRGTIANSLEQGVQVAEDLGLMGDLKFYWSREPTFLAWNCKLLMQMVPRVVQPRHPSRVSWAWCRGTHTSDKPQPGSARASEAAPSSPPFPLSLLSFLPQIPQGHLLAPALEHGPQNSQGMKKRFESSTEKGNSDWGKGGGHQGLLWGRGVPRALTPSPATGQGPSLTELALVRLPNTDMNPPQPPGPSSWFPPSQAPVARPPTGLHPNSPETLSTDPRLCLS